MQKIKFFIFFFLPFLFIFSLPKANADISIPLLNIPYPNLTLYYLIEGESIIQKNYPMFMLGTTKKMNLPVDILRVTFPEYDNESVNGIKYNLDFFGFSNVITSSINRLSRIDKDGMFCPFYLKYSGLPNLIGLEFNWVFEYGGIKYVKWNSNWIKTHFYFLNYRDGSTTYSYRFYYDYTSYILVLLEEETVTNMVQTQYMKYSLIIGNVFLTFNDNFTGEWNNLTNYIIASIVSAIIALVSINVLINKKKSQSMSFFYQ